MTQVVDGYPASFALDQFVDWIELTDPHASHHLKLLQTAVCVRLEEQSLSQTERLELSDKLERWRYQLINHYSGKLAATDWRLADALDLASNELAGRPERLPRSPRIVLDGWPTSDLPMSSAADFDRTDVETYLDPSYSLDELVRRAKQLTQQRFSVQTAEEPKRDVGLSGPSPDPPERSRVRQMKLYAPLYLSNYCVNHCLYCGFRHPHALERTHLTQADALRQAEILWNHGFRHVLVVAGDFPQRTSIDYFAKIIRALKECGFAVGIEIAAQSTSGYAELSRAGVSSLTLYQETYDQELYAHYHPRGTKASFDWRLEAHDRAAEAGIHRLGLGVLLGLCDPVQDVLVMIRHAYYLLDRFPDIHLAFSLPRIFEAPDGFQPPYSVDDELFVRLYCALRVIFPRADLVLSTREPEELRSRLARICITQMSAGSSTAPGGYQTNGQLQISRQQFPVVDMRSPAEVAEWLQTAGFAVRWGLEPTPTFSRERTER